MKRLYSFLISIFIYGAVSAQCTVFATQYIWPDTNNLSQCFQLGDTLVIDAYSNQVSTPLNNSFEIGSLGAGWAAGASVNVIINNPAHCAWPPPVNPIPNNAYVWMGNLAAHPRNLTSVDFDLSACSNLEFDMKYATQSQAGPCEGPDLYCEGVRIQYSTDAGLSWYNWDGSLEQPWTPPGSGLPNSLTGVCATHPVYAYNGIGYWDPDTNGVSGGLGGPSPYTDWFHVNIALGISNEENLENIRESAKLFIKEKKEFMFDAEHFFDGFKNNKEYALSCIKSAYDNGARWIVLCDTNGGTLPNEVSEIVNEVVLSLIHI